MKAGVSLHERVIDGDDEDFAGVAELRAADVARDVSVGACWA